MPERLPTPIDDGRELKDVRLRMLLDHWRAASRQGLMPSRDFIDPGRLGDLMGWIFLYRVDRAPSASSTCCAGRKSFAASAWT